MQTFSESASETTIPKLRKRCPCLGTAEDPGTALAYASTANHCYRLDDPLPVSFGHQQDFCLATTHTSCSVFRNNEATALAMERSVVDGNSLIAESKQNRWSRPAFFAVLTTLLILFFVGLWQIGAKNLAQWQFMLPKASFNSAAQTVEITPSPLASPIHILSAGSGDGVEGVGLSITPTSKPTSTATAVSTSPRQAVPTSSRQAVSTSPKQTVTPANTSVATNTPTATATHVPTATAVPCGPPSWWYAYTVRPGDTASQLAQSQGITLAQLMQANCLTNSNLFWGQVLRLPNPIIEPTVVPPTFPSPGATAVPTQSIPNPTATSSLGDETTPASATPEPTAPPPTEVPPTPLPPPE